ncbi:class I SAM-dependent methyltransferase [Psychrobacillus antarcticus]|uniref:class I SAM-dependent methyltransferase n=1 Tax=Psychrobacillus antarcticus TaxID=2879115 RepID=UPI002407CAFE|nr:class I SAM-dependent methyltransferase [Psychrobacillus antarcticus]
MPKNEFDSTIQTVQTEHRLKLVDFWNIKAGTKVLEIGCGQGDTTAVLAHIVGETGFVHGIDIAPPDYGSPVTLGDSINFLKNSSLGNRIKVDFEMDILSAEVDFPEKYFDYIVLSHCSWYLKSPEEFLEILKKIKKWTNILCFAEWDTRVQTDEQLPHFLSVLIQAQYECFAESSLSNVRTLFTPKDIQQIAGNASWEIISEKTIDSTHLQDGKWEIDATLTDYKELIESDSHLPAKYKALIQSEMYLLEDVRNQSKVPSMNTYAFIAKAGE